ncbi:MAG TPA: hypothetical protein VIE46_06080 [Gemmatimonadales bacterium]
MKIALRILLHTGFLLIAVGCLAAYAHFKAEGQSGASLASLVAAAGFGFAPVRDLVRLVFGIEGKALHLVHGLGGLALVGLPLAGVVSGGPVLTHAAMAPFAIMGAAQAVMHQDHPRNALAGRGAPALRHEPPGGRAVHQLEGPRLARECQAGGGRPVRHHRQGAGAG